MENVIELKCMTLENALLIRISAISKWDFESQFNLLKSLQIFPFNIDVDVSSGCSFMPMIGNSIEETFSFTKSYLSSIASG